MSTEDIRPYSLTPEQCSSFQKNGFLVLPPFSANVTQNLIKWTDEIKALPHQPNAWMHYEEIDAKGQRILTRTENFVNYHQGFEQALKSPALVGFLEQLTGEKMVLFKEKINYKSPAGGGFAPHIDAPAYKHVANVKHLTVLMAVDEMSTENGCLEIVPGSHNEEIPLGPDVCILPSWCDEHEWIPVPLEPGAMLIFGSYFAHRSGPNNSDKGRAAIYATYNAFSDGGDRHDAYYENRRKHWPPTADRIPGQKYEEGARLFGWGSPMLSVDAQTYKNMGL